MDAVELVQHSSNEMLRERLIYEALARLQNTPLILGVLLFVGVSPQRVSDALRHGYTLMLIVSPKGGARFAKSFESRP